MQVAAFQEEHLRPVAAHPLEHPVRTTNFDGVLIHHVTNIQTLIRRADKMTWYSKSPRYPPTVARKSTGIHLRRKPFVGRPARQPHLGLRTARRFAPLRFGQHT